MSQNRPNSLCAERVMVADPHSGRAAALEMLLAEHVNAITVSSDAREAQELAAAMRFDFTVLAMDAPDWGGSDLLDRLRQDETTARRAPTPVIGIAAARRFHGVPGLFPLATPLNAGAIKQVVSHCLGWAPNNQDRDFATS